MKGDQGCARIQTIKRLRVFSLLPNGEKHYFDTSDAQESAIETDLPLLRTTVTEFPCILNSSGSPWFEANKYLLESVYQTLSESSTTPKSVAIDLLRFLRFLEAEGIDFRSVPKRKPLSALYRFRFELKQQVDDRCVAATTAKRCIGRVTSFYKWAVEVGLVSKELLPDASMKTRYSSVAKPVSLEEARLGSNGGKGELRPLTLDEQLKLLTVLASSNHVEMSLIFKTALLTGLRMQSVLTLKKCIFKRIDSNSGKYVSVPLGLGTGMDTKFDKPITVSFPAELIRRLELYYCSERSIRRRSKKHEQDYSDYIFLSNRGQPYYITKEDRLNFGGVCRAEGEAVRAYMRSKLIPDVGFKFRFHDLRATFAMNLVEAQLALVQSKQITLHQARIYVRDRLGQASVEVTDGYLNYRSFDLHAKEIQNNYENIILDTI